MKKFTANYLITPSGEFLKNGIVIISDDGMASEFIDTKGDLREIAQLIFNSGILVPNFEFRKNNEPAITLDAFIETAKGIQQKNTGLTIPEIFAQLTESLHTNGDFTKNMLPGLFRLTGNDLVHLKFSKECKCKRIV
jgi:hypothetical protein